jgi:hypothetical protein
MSIHLGGTPTAATNAAITSFDNEAVQAYQGAARLRNTVTVKSGVTGAVHQFQTIGAGAAVNHSTAELVTPMDVAHGKVPATLSNWVSAEYTDLFDQAEANVDERMELAQVIGMALGRTEDQLIIDALDAATGIAGTVDEDIGGTNSSINADKLRKALRYLRAQQGTGGDFTFIHTAAALEAMLAETEVTSSDFQVVKALINGEMSKAFGFNRFICIETRAEGGLPNSGSTSIVNCFAYDRKAVGLAVGIEPKTSVDWIAERRSWLSCGDLKAGAAVRLPTGVVAVESYET